MTRRDTSEEIDAIAADWVARIDRGALDADELRNLDRWLNNDVRHHGALVRCQAIWSGLGPVSEIAPPRQIAEDLIDIPDTGMSSGVSRRALLAGGVSISLLTAATLFWFRSPRTKPQQFVTLKRQTTTLKLEDGSQVVVKGDSALAFEFDERRRQVSLNKGETWFDVAKDPSRPFIVRTDQLEAKAVGTAFAVARRSGSTLVTVTHGLVQISAAGGKVQVSPGSRAVVSGDGQIRVTALGLDLAERELGWREGRVILNGETVAEAALRFNDANDTQLTIADDALGNEQVIGSFNIDQPRQFAEAVVSIYGGKVTELRAGEVVLAR